MVKSKTGNDRIAYACDDTNGGCTATPNGLEAGLPASGLVALSVTGLQCHRRRPELSVRAALGGAGQQAC